MISSTKGPFRPITKNINVDQWLMLAKIASKHASVDEFTEEAVHSLPQATRKTRQEWVGRFRSTFLSIQNDRIEHTPVLRIWGSDETDVQLKRELLYLYYLRRYPLLWHACLHLLLPKTHMNQPSSKENDVLLEEWNSFLKLSLVECAESTFVRTRNHLTAFFQKFGLIEADTINGERLEKRFVVNPVRPSLEALLFGLSLEFLDNGLTSRTYDYLSQESWTRVAFLTPENLMRWALDQAEEMGLGYSDYFGSEKQFTWRGSDPTKAVSDHIVQAGM